MAKEKFDRSKEHANIGTIGHVDHGKTCSFERSNFSFAIIKSLLFLIKVIFKFISHDSFSPS
jgi:translation elongation factor EF-Tu-like GTPase